MNLKFWKKKKVPEESDNSAADETLVATETNATPPKPGFWTRLKSTLSPWRKKSEPDVADEAKPSASHKDNKHQDEESESPPPKPGFLARLKNLLLPTRKKDKTEDEEKPEERKSSAKRTDRKHPDEEPEPSDIPAKKPRKRLVIALALLIPLAAGGGFFAATKFLPPPHQETPSAKDAASQEVKVDGQPAPEPTEAAEQAPKQEPVQPPTEPAPQQADNATTPVAEVPAPPAEAPVAEAPADEDLQTQIQAMKKQNQEMQAQIEALKKQPAGARPAKSTATPREGVLIINGKNAKESAQGLKKVIEGMNAASGANDTSGKK